MTDLQAIEEKALELVRLAEKAGADDCDVVVARGDSLSVNVRDGKVENNKRSEGDSVSLRVFKDGQVASVDANQIANLEQLAERAVAMAKVSPKDPYQGLADKNLLSDAATITERAAMLDLYDDTLISVEELTEKAMSAEAAGLSVKGVEKSMGASAGWGRNGFVLATSQGFSGSYERSGFSVSASLLAGEGTAMERDYDYDSAVHLEDLKEASKIGLAAGERTVRRLSPKQVASGQYPIIFEPRTSSGLLGSFIGAISGSSVARKTSFLREQMNKTVANTAITILDDPHMKRKNGSKIFDGEGVDLEALDLVSAGTLNHWLLDCATARELELQTNGRAARAGAGTTPSTTNCYMKPGTVSPQELYGGISDGLYVTETIGHGINMVTGDYSKGASGFWIENGEISYPVAGITIAGNLKDMMMNATPASDLEFKYGTNAPTLLVEGMTVGGL